MTRFRMILFLSAVMSAMMFAQLPQDGLKGLWKFDDPANLTKATIGNALVEDELVGVIPYFRSIAGPTAGDGAIEVGLGSYLRCFHDLSPNGSDTAKGVNQFTLVIDFKMTQRGIWYAFHAVNQDPASDDAESFINSSGHIGVGTTGYSFDTVSTDQWYRLVIAADLGHTYKYYIDGRVALDASPQKLDGRFALSSINDADQVVLFGDNDGDDGTIDCAMVALYNRALTDEEVFNMGGYGHELKIKTPVSEWAFDKPDTLLAANIGKQLELSGVQTAITGPTTIDGAASLDPGSYYISHPALYKNGGGENVNLYTVSYDLKMPAIGKQYSLLQTSPTNADSAEIVINKEGKIGSPYTGFTSKPLVAGEWYRVTVAAELGNKFVYYIDGDSVLNGGALPIDGRFSLSPANVDGRVLFFAGAAGEANGMDIAHLSIYNRALSTTDIKGQGGFVHEVNTEKTSAGNSIYLDGSSNNRYVSVPKSPTLDLDTTSFAIEAWVKPNITVDGDPSIISNKDWNSGGNPGWVLALQQDNWKFNIADGTHRYDASQPKITDGNWHYIAAIVNRATGAYKLITDTVVTVDIPFTNGLGDVNTQLNVNIGEDGTGNYADGYKYPGEIDEIRIWKGVAVDPAVLQAWKFKTVTSAHPYYNNLVGYWKFDDATSTTVTDASGKNNTATLVNSPSFDVSYAPIADSLVAPLSDVTGIYGGAKHAYSGGLIADGIFTSILPTAVAKKNASAKPSILESASDNPFAIFGHNNGVGATGSDVAGSAALRTTRVWTFDVTNASVKADVTFDFSTLSIGAPGDSSNYVLLARKGASGAFSVVNASAPTVVDGNQLVFKGITLTDNRYALGTKNATTSPLGTLVDVKTQTSPVKYSLSEAYPNPFNPSTNIKFSLAVKSKVTLKIYNMLGQEIQTLINQDMDSGVHSIVWNSRNSSVNVASGVYFYTLNAKGQSGEQFVQTKKLLLVK